MKKFLESIWFPIVLFLVLESILFMAGIFTYPLCKQGGDCPSLGQNYALWGLIPSTLISVTTYLLIKMISKNTN